MRDPAKVRDGVEGRRGVGEGWRGGGEGRRGVGVRRRGIWDGKERSWGGKEREKINGERVTPLDALLPSFAKRLHGFGENLAHICVFICMITELFTHPLPSPSPGTPTRPRSSANSRIHSAKSRNPLVSSFPLPFPLIFNPSPSFIPPIIRAFIIAPLR